MGGGLADGISQGEATGSQFRTAPLLGIGKRIISLHDGRTIDLLQAILAHGGEATQVRQLQWPFIRPEAEHTGLSAGVCRREQGVANNDAFTL